MQSLAPAFLGNLPPAQVAAVSYLARYRGSTHKLYSRHLGDWFTWCGDQGLDPLEGITRGHIEFYVRYRLETRGNKESSTRTALAPVKGFFRFAHIDGLIDRDPAAYIMLPPIHETDPQFKSGIDRQEMTRFLAASRDISPQHYALGHILGLLGLRASELCSLDIEDRQESRSGYEVLTVVGKGGKPATVPLTVPVVRAINSSVGNRKQGPLVLSRSGNRLDRHYVGAMVRTICRHANIDRRISPHAIRRSAITIALDAGVPLRDVQHFARHADPRVTAKYDRGRANLDRHATHILTAYVAGG